MQSRPAAERREELVALYREASGCLRCPLHESRTRVVFGNGNADADLMFVGEGPGQQEDIQGLPFVGRAGKLLDQLLEEIGLSRGRRVRHERGALPPARQPRPAARRDRSLPVLHRPPDRADRAEADLHARQVRHAGGHAHEPRHHGRARQARGARAGRADGARVPRLPPGGGAALDQDARGPARGLRAHPGAARGAAAGADRGGCARGAPSRCRSRTRRRWTCSAEPAARSTCSARRAQRRRPRPRAPSSRNASSPATWCS